MGVAVDSSGAILVADDVGNMIWRVSPAAVTTDHRPMNKAINTASANQPSVSSQPIEEKAANNQRLNSK